MRFIARTREGAKQGDYPGFVMPCRPTLRKTPPTGDGWLHEIKHDGYRVQAPFFERPRIYTRRGHDWADRMPTIAAALTALPANTVILDGELVALDARGREAFYKLPAERQVRVKGRLVYYAFDLLYLDGFDLRAERRLASASECSVNFSIRPAWVC